MVFNASASIQFFFHSKLTCSNDVSSRFLVIQVDKDENIGKVMGATAWLFMHG